MADKLSSIQYTSLKHGDGDREIRLLLLDTDKSNTCSLHAVSLKGNYPPYVALSYCWGEFGSDRLSVDGVNVSISRNLSRALRSTRTYWRQHFHQRPLFVWCDQICINQQSNSEKGHQVAFMGEIYQRAEQVFVSLGSLSGRLHSSTRSIAFVNVEGVSAIPYAVSVRAVQMDAAGEMAEFALTDRMFYREGIASEKYFDGQSTIVPYPNEQITIKASLGSLYYEGTLKLDLTENEHAVRVALHQDWGEGRIFINIRCSVQEQGAWYNLERIERRTEGDFKVSPVVHNGERFVTPRPPFFKRIMGREDKAVPSAPELIPDDTIQAWQGFHALLSDPWWIRVWIFQEYMFGCQTIFFASGQSILADDLAATFKKMHKRRARLEKCVSQIRREPVTVPAASTWEEGKDGVRRPRGDDKHYQAMRMKQELDSLDHIAKDPVWQNAAFLLQRKSEIASKIDQQPTIPLSELLSYARNCNCTDPRDRVYAFLGFVDPSYQIRVDYSPSNTWADVAIDAFVAILRKERDLNTIMLAIEARQMNPLVNQLPTWVPDYSIRDDTNSEYKAFLSGIDPQIKYPPPPRISNPTIIFSSDERGRPNRELTVVGHHVDTLSVLIPPESKNPNPHLKWFRGHRRGAPGLYGVPSTATRNDEIWVVDGLLYPIVVSKRQRGYVLRGHAGIKTADGGFSPGEFLDTKMTLI